MKSFFQQETPENNLKKGRKHYGKQYSKRPWKTPSPNLHVEFKSPRFIRNQDKEGKDKNKQKQKDKVMSRAQEQHFNQYKIVSKVTSKAKNIPRTIQQSEQYSKSSQNKLQWQVKKDGLTNRFRAKNNLRKSATQQDLNPYNHYFQKKTIKKSQQELLKDNQKLSFQLRDQLTQSDSEKHKEPKNKVQNDLKSNNQTKSPKQSKSISLTDKQGFKNMYQTKNCSEDSKQQNAFTFSSTTKFQETIRRYSKQNMKFKKLVEQYLHQIKHLKEEKQSFQKEKDKYKDEVAQLGLKIYQLKQQIYRYQIQAEREQKTHNYSSESCGRSGFNEKQSQRLSAEKIKHLEEQLSKNQKELEASNLQIYKMKQQIFELQLEKKKLKEDKIKFSENCKEQEQNKKLPPNKQQIKKIRNSSKSTSQKPSPKNQTTFIQQPKEEECRGCFIKQKIILEFAEILENTILQRVKKQNVIKNLVQNIKNLQNQIRLFQKPKNIYKKYGQIVGQLNQQAIRTQIISLNRKYCQQVPQIDQHQIVKSAKSHMHVQSKIK